MKCLARGLVSPELGWACLWEGHPDRWLVFVEGLVVHCKLTRPLRLMSERLPIVVTFGNSSLVPPYPVSESLVLVGFPTDELTCRRSPVFSNQ